MIVFRAVRPVPLGGLALVRVSGHGHGRRMGSNRRLLAAIQATHSAVFFVELASILWLVASGVMNRRDRSVAIAGGLVAVEGAVWLANERICPLTPLAERYGAASGSVSDIWLPDPIAKTIPQWSIPLVASGVVLHMRGFLAGRRRRG